MRNKEEGFTLVELLVVISIIGVLTAIAAVIFQNVTVSTRDAKRQSNARTMAAAYESKFDINTRRYRELQDTDFTTGSIPSTPEYYHTTGNSSASAIACSTLEKTGDNYCIFSLYGSNLPTPVPYNFGAGARLTVTPMPTQSGSTPTPSNPPSTPSPTSAIATYTPTPTSGPSLTPTPTSVTSTLTPSPTSIPVFTPSIATPACISAGYTGSGVTISWVNGTPTVIAADISTDSLFPDNNFYNREYLTGTSTTGPLGFTDYLTNTSPLSLNPVTTYYVRLYRGISGEHSVVQSFSIPACATPTPTPTSSVLRDPLVQPFASTSIWNMPIGSNAVYVPANLNPNPGNVTGDPWLPGLPSIDDEIIVMKPSSPLTDVNYSSAGWSGANRCSSTGGLLTRVNMPADFLVPNSGKNSSATFLNSDNHTLQQLQPLARCTAGGYATAMVQIPNADIYGDGLEEGAHGGSGLSAFGGSIRMGELRPGQTGMRHALKVNVFAKEALFNCDDRNGLATPGNTADDCYRWPARWADGYAVGWYGTFNNNLNTAMKMGALLAIPASTNITSLGLESEPGMQIAWTLQNYGAYIVDDTYDEAFSFNAEKGPDGSKRTEFAADWAMPFESFGAPNTAWERDIQRLISALSVVNNNSSTNIGGGGTPLQPLALDILGVTSTPDNTLQSIDIFEIIKILLFPQLLLF